MHCVTEEFISIFKQYATKIALICDSTQLTYNALRQEINIRAAYLRAHNLNIGDRIAVSNDSRLEQLLWALTSIFEGFTLIPINSNMPNQINHYILASTKPHIEISQECHYASSNINIAEWKKRAFNFPQTIHYTSGTTGQPKGVCHSIERLLGNAKAFNQHMNINDNIRMLHVMPVTYMAGFLNTFLLPLMAGGTVIVAPQFNSLTGINLWDHAIQHSANAIWLTPTMAHFLAKCLRNPKTAEWVKNNIQFLMVGTAPLLKATRQFFESVFEVPCLESYGLSELLLLTSQQREKTTLSVGSCLPGVELQIVNSENAIVASNEIGTIFAKTQYNMLGYLDPDTHQVDNQNIDWINTGDLGYLDQEGELHITGRAKDLIIKGGVNISPRQVEEALMTIPGIHEAAVIGAPHPFWGEQVLAFIVPSPNSELNDNNIKSQLKEKISIDAIPEQIRFIPILPRSSNGKIQPHKLKKLI